MQGTHIRGTRGGWTRTASAGLACAALGLTAAAFAAPASADSQVRHVRASGALTDLQAGSNPTDGVSAWFKATVGANRTVSVLHLSGFDAEHAGDTFGAHIHSGTCVALMGSLAGPHYNSTGQPPSEVSTDTEVWLDFTVDSDGVGHATAVVPFAVTAGGASAVVIHDHETAPDGSAGPRLACLSVTF